MVASARPCTADGIASGSESIAHRWLQGEEVLGRPADLPQADDGALLVSDDYNGFIYRISYSADDAGTTNSR